jgi:hypothetical protein
MKLLASVVELFGVEGRILLSFKEREPYSYTAPDFTLSFEKIWRSGNHLSEDMRQTF